MNGDMAANAFASILCQNERFMLSKVDLNSLRLFDASDIIKSCQNELKCHCL